MADFGSALWNKPTSGETGEGGGGGSSDPVTRSLRLEDNAYLSFTPSSATTTREKVTINFWFKLAEPEAGSARYTQFFTAGAVQGSGTEWFGISYESSSGKITTGNAYGTGGGRTTEAVFRDYSSWYNLHLIVDTTESTAATKIKLYINGELQSMTGTHAPTGNLHIGEAQPHRFSWQPNSSHATSFGPQVYIANAYLLENSTLPFTDFIEDTGFGSYKPKETSGLTFGANGFHLKFEDSSDIGADSANSNDFTPTNLASHDIMLDVPTKNYCTLNPLDKHPNISIEQGNLKTSDSVTGGNNYDGIRGTIGLPKTGKWYWECRLSTESYITGLGIADGSGNIQGSQNAPSKRNFLGVGSWFRIYNSNTPKHMINQDGTSGSDWSQASNPSQSGGSIYMVAVDMDNGTAWWGKDGSWFANSSGTTANPASNAGAQATGLNDGTTWFPFSQQADQSAEAAMAFNFGADNTFAGSVTSGQDTSQSEFYYAPPTGFKSLNSSNLDAPSVTPEENFNTVLYAGSGNNTQDITGVGFEPNLVWIKNRTQGTSHYVVDSVRGLYDLHTNNTAVEGSSANRFNSFDSDGFQVEHSGGGNGFTNGASQNYVAWNWKAHQSPSSSSTRTTYTVKVEDNSGDAWDSSGAYYDSSTYLPSVYMEIFENRNSSLVSLGKVAVRYYDSSGNSMSDTSEQTYTLECADLDAITVKWHYDTSGDGDEYDYPNSYNDYLNDQKITILDGTTSEWTTNNYSNDDGTSSNYSPPTGWADGDELKSATTSYNGSDTATLTSDSGSSGPTEKYNAAAGFTIISYSGDGSSDGDTQTLDHSLGVPLEFVIAKARTSNDSFDNGDWIVWHKDLASSKYLFLNENYAQRTEASGYNLISTATSGAQHQVQVGNGTDNSSYNYHYLNSGPDNGTGEDYILYGWAGVENYSRFGKYTGNGSSDGPMVYTGHTPRWIAIKRINSSDHWCLYDTARFPENPNSTRLEADTSDNEVSASTIRIDVLSNGFKLRGAGSTINANGSTYVFASFASVPFAKATAR